MTIKRRTKMLGYDQKKETRAVVGKQNEGAFSGNGGHCYTCFVLIHRWAHEEIQRTKGCKWRSRFHEHLGLLLPSIEEKIVLRHLSSKT